MSWSFCASVNSLFSLYPTFKEWKLGYKETIPAHSFVYILPLRNENSTDDQDKLLKTFSLYPTFKEWKHNYFLDFLFFFHHVYILPLRNENKERLKEYQLSYYLVYILPLRNENANVTVKASQWAYEFISYL